MMAAQQRTFASADEKAVAGEVALPVALTRATQTQIDRYPQTSSTDDGLSGDVIAAMR